MPEREARFNVNAPPAELWKFLRDFRALCTCIPGVERIHVVDQRTAELTVKESEVVLAGSGATLLVGTPASIVVRASLAGSVPWLGSCGST